MLKGEREMERDVDVGECWGESDGERKKDGERKRERWREGERERERCICG